MTETAAKQIGIVLFPDVEELDAIGPWEVLSYWTRNFPQDGYAVSCLSSSGGLVQCPKGLVVQAHHSFADAPPLEVLLYPGGRGTRAQLVDDLQLDWVRRQREAVPLMTSVCTGSLIYAAAGLLAGRPATTHWGSLDRLAELDPSIDVRRDERIVDDGDVVTSAGISAGIDMALHLVARLADVERAQEVCRGIQYDPAHTRLTRHSTLPVDGPATGASRVKNPRRGQLPGRAGGSRRRARSGACSCRSV